MNNPEKRRPVMTMHKLNDAGTGLAVGKVFRFPGSGDAYQVGVSGAVRRVEPKLNKKERRKDKLARTTSAATGLFHGAGRLARTTSAATGLL